MSTNPFDEVKRPIRGESVEIGQSTFVEVVTAKLCTTAPSIGRSNVSNSLRRLAFASKDCTNTLTDTPTAIKQLSAIPPINASQNAGFAYNLNKNLKLNNHINNIKTAKISTEFKALTNNILNTRAFNLLPGVPAGCGDPCLSTTEDDICAVDFAIILDDTGSMGPAIDAVKLGIGAVVDLLRNTIGNNFRLSLITFKDEIRCRLPFNNLCGNASYTAFQNAINQVFASGGNDEPEASAAAVLYASTGNCGCWRQGNIVRAMVVITDAPNNEAYNGISVQEAADMAASNGIRIAFAGIGDFSYGDNQGGIYAETTNGINIRLGPEGTGLVSLLQTFVFSLCSSFIPTPECEGGTNLVINGTFDNNINGWHSTGTVVWDGAFQSVDPFDQVSRSIRLNKGASIRQDFTGLNPGDLVLLNYNWCLRPDISSLSAPTIISENAMAYSDIIKPYIINPNANPETGFKAVGKLGRTNGGPIVYDCSCTLISSKFVLTAAHCVNNPGIPETGYRVDFDGIVYNSAKIYTHPLWNPTLINTDLAYDIAIIELNSDVADITPFGISSSSGAPGTGPDPAVNSLVRIVGYGLTGNDAGPVDETFGQRRSGYQIVDEITTTLIRYIFNISGEASAAPGDSGGPVLFADGGTYYITGVVSGGSGPEPIGKIGTTIFNTRVSAFSEWIFGILNGDSETIIGELRDSSNNPIQILDGSSPTSYNAFAGDCSKNRQLRAPVRVRVPADGIVKAYFELSGSGPNTHWLYLDQITCCVLSNEDCGPGARNLILNGNFESGVAGWTDASGTPLPTIDPTVWDNDILALIVNLTEESEVRYNLTGLVPGRDLSLSFEIASYEPDILTDLRLDYGVKNSGGVNIAFESVYNLNIQPTPTRVSVPFTVPSNGIATIFIKTGNVGGVAKIRNVLCCDLSGACEEGYNRISHDEFNTDRGSWSGGIYDTVAQHIILTTADPTMTQTFPGLEPGSTFQISISVKNSGSVIMTLFSDDIAEQLITPTSSGYYTKSVVVQDGGFVIVSIQRQGSTDANIDNILCCASSPASCDGSISGIQVLIEWNGIPREPVNLFNAVIRYTVRDPNDPFNAIEMTYAPISVGRLSVAACDLWKSQTGSLNPLSTGLSNIGNINAGSFSSVSSKSDWLWSIPQDSTNFVQDNLVINFPDPDPSDLIESVDVLFLANHITPQTGTDTTPIYPPPLSCSQDPSTSFNVYIRYINSKGLSREFGVEIPLDDLWEQTADFSVGSPWDTDAATGNGIKGSSARWESALFKLDTVDGNGLDQCTTALFYDGVAQGTLNFSRFQIQGFGTFIDPCDSEVIVEDISSGEFSNEIQSITLPSPTGGTWTLSFSRLGEIGTITLPWNTTADQLRNRLGELEMIGSKNNLIVTGEGTEEEPFLIEFVNDLSAIDLNLMVADGSNLTGSAPAIVTTETNGTPNERKTISNPSDGRQDLIITFNGYTSIPIPYGSSINEVQYALEGMGSIGTGNISVTGRTTDRNATYSGPYYLDFINDLGNQNIPVMSVEPDHYTIITNWNGGPNGGQNESQLIDVLATGGTFVIRVFNTANTTFYDTAPIAYNSSADNLKAAIVSVVPFITNDDISVTIVEQDNSIGHTIWNIIFKGSLARTNIPQMRTNSDNLTGSDILVKEVQKGYGVNERQRITVTKANAGSFKLTINIGGKKYKTTRIPWNTTAEGLQDQLLALAPFSEGDLTVTELPKTSSDQQLRVSVVFRKKFGNIPLMVPDFQTTLLCDPIALPPVPPGPYDYQIKTCDLLEDFEHLSGPLLCRPGEGDEYAEEIPCCNASTIPDSANFSRRIKFERDLFDPNPSKTIRKLALLKGIDPLKYTPYIRNYNNGQLTETSYDIVASTKMSIVLVENEIDTASWRQRISNHVTNQLSARFVWPDCNVLSSISSELCWPGVS